MIWTIVIVLIILWFLGFITAIGGPFIHILLVIALILIIVRLLQGKNLVTDFYYEKKTFD